MKRLTNILRKLKTYTKLSFRTKLLTVEAFFLTAVVRAAILLIPFNKIKSHLGTYKEDSAFVINSDDYKVIKNVSWAVNTISRYTPWESLCLVQAMTAQRMLKRRGICSTLYLGVGKEGSNAMKAHAWLRSGQAFVTGGSNRNEFVEVARFSNEDLHP